MKGTPLIGVIAVTMWAFYFFIFHDIIRHPNYIKVSVPEYMGYKTIHLYISLCIESHGKRLKVKEKVFKLKNYY